MRIVRTVADVRAALEGGDEAGLVPTMGALHEGHASLLTTARAENEVVVASLFVNPAQFDEESDLAAYPRDEDADLDAFRRHGVDVVFAPAREEMYAPGFATWVEPAGAAVGLEGDARPGHFRGVATICLKLFNIVRPARAYFGRKDAQQVAVLKQLVRDLDLDVEIRVVDTVRDPDGLALSSRNALLTPEARETALAIPRALATHDAARAHAVLADAGVEPDYVAVADLDGPTLAIAARIGPIRLIDNVLLEGDPA